MDPRTGTWVETYVRDHDPSEVFVFGGPDVVSDRAVERIEEIW